MKRLSRTLLLMLVLAMCTGLTSCEWIVVNDNPVDPTPTPTPTPETIVKATDLLKEAQKEGAKVVFWYHYEGGLFYAVFKKVGDVYVYQEGGNCNKASTRGSVVYTQLTPELLELKGDEADLGFNVYSADDAGNKNDPIILCKVFSSTAEVKQKTNSPDNYLAAMAANIQNISMKTIVDDVKDLLIINTSFNPENNNKNLENVLLVTADNNTDQLLFKSLPEIEKNAAEQGTSPEKAIGTTFDNLKQNVAEKYEDGSSKIPEVYFEDENPSRTWNPNAGGNTYQQELQTTGMGTVTYHLQEGYTGNAMVDSKSGKVMFQKPGEVTVVATFTYNDGFQIFANYTLTVEKAAGSISYPKEPVTKTLADDDFTIELKHVGDALVSYSSSNTNVATVDAQSGKVKIVGDGKTTITATVEDTDYYHYETTSASYELEVVEPESNGALEDYNRNDATEQ